MPNRKFTPEKPTTELFLPTILDRLGCGRHKVPVGVPCFHVVRDGFGRGAGICNYRAKKAGFNHPVDPKSLRRNQGKK